MGADGYSSEGETRVTARVPQGLKDDFSAACDAEDESMTDALNEMMKEYVAEHGDSSEVSHLPDDDTLAEGYRRLRRLADPDTGRVEADVAVTEISKALGRPQSTVRRSVLNPLERRGYIDPRWGVIRVVEPEEAAQTTATSDDASVEA